MLRGALTMLRSPIMVAAGMVTVARFMVAAMVMEVRASALALAEGASAVGMGVSAVADSVAINGNAHRPSSPTRASRPMRRPQSGAFSTARARGRALTCENESIRAEASDTNRRRAA